MMLQKHANVYISEHALENSFTFTTKTAETRKDYVPSLCLAHTQGMKQ